MCGHNVSYRKERSLQKERFLLSVLHRSDNFVDGWGVIGMDRESPWFQGGEKWLTNNGTTLKSVLQSTFCIILQ